MTQTTKTYTPDAMKMMLKFQKNEITSSIIYTHFAKHLKDIKNKKVLMQIASEEGEHAKIWQRYTHQEVKPNRLKILWYVFLTYVLGYTFVVKLLENEEYSGAKDLEELKKEIPEVKHIIAQEEKHEQHLVNMLEEERLNYVGAMVLGLNDALVELTGTIAGLTFVLMNTTLIALAGIITGIAATLSMAASNYLAERVNGNPKAIQACIYTGIAYVVTVVLLVLPYLFFPVHMYLGALLTMIAVVVLVIFCFNYYISVVRSERFWPRFLEMASISLSVALISFLIGLLAKLCFNLDV